MPSRNAWTVSRVDLERVAGGVCIVPVGDWLNEPFDKEY